MNSQSRAALMSDLHSAAVGRLEWSQALGRLCDCLDLWASQIIGVDKRTGGLIFSSGGWPKNQDLPGVELDYIRFFHTSNPRLLPAMRNGVGKWFHCHEHFDDNFVARNRFYQEFLLPHGGRYLSGTKLLENDDYVYLLGVMRGVGKAPIGIADVELLEEVKHHASEAMHNQVFLRAQSAEFEMARAFLEQFSYPMLVLDETRGIWQANAAAKQILATRDPLVEKRGVLTCITAAANNLLTEAIRSIHLIGSSRHPSLQRRVVSVPAKNGRVLRLFISALRPDESMNMFGLSHRVLVILHDESDANGELDPLLVAECFSLTPGEARVAVKLTEGRTAAEISREQGTSIATVRTQIQQCLQKTGCTRQTNLVRMLLTMPLRKRRP